MARKNKRPRNESPREPAQPLSKEAMSNIIAVLTGENDRGCTITATAIIEDALELMLRDKFARDAIVPHDDAEDMIEFADLIDQLLTTGALPPISSLYMRGNMCRALGLIDRKLWYSLDELRLLRNKAAHGKEVFDLDQHKIPHMIAALTATDKKMLDTLTADEALLMFQVKKSRAAFTWAAMAIYTRLVLIGSYPDRIREILDPATETGMGELLFDRERMDDRSDETKAGDHSGGS